MSVDAPLEVAEDVVAAGYVVAKVAQGLHDLSPLPRRVGPASVAVELLVVLDEGLLETLDPRPAPRPSVKGPDLGDVDLDGLVEDVEPVEAIGNLEGLVDSLDVQGEEIGFEGGARLEPLAYARLARPAALSVLAPRDPAEGSRGKRVPERLTGEFGTRRSIVAATVGWSRIGFVKVVTVNASGATGQAFPFGILVACIRRPRQIALTIRTDAAHFGLAAAGLKTPCASCNRRCWERTSRG